MRKKTVKLILFVVRCDDDTVWIVNKTMRLKKIKNEKKEDKCEKSVEKWKKIGVKSEICQSNWHGTVLMNK